ncbi:MAG: NADP-dependent oxidoreductase [Alphaproteobacteria bacterium]
MAETNRQVHLASRPKGWVSEENFTLVEAAVPEPAEGQVLIRNHYASVDPYMRGGMNDVASYRQPFALNATMPGRTVGEVVASRLDGYREGDFVFAMTGWADYGLASDDGQLRRIDPAQAPISYHLGVLGMPGMTAYVGTYDLGEPKAGEQFYVSAAAGAVGQVAGQLARIRGCRVIGSAGGPEKIAWLTGELGFDGAFDHHAEDYTEALDRLMPDGIDVYFDNVGGAALDAVLARVNMNARLVECGMVSQYNLTTPDGIHNIANITRNRVRIQGFIVSDHADRLDAFLDEVSGYLRDGQMHYAEDVVDGLENTPAAFIGMLKGENTGKRVVKYV